MATELYYGIILMEKILGMPGEPPEPPGTAGDPRKDALVIPGAAPGTPGDPHGPQLS